MPNEFFQSHLCVSSLLWRGRPIEEMARSMMDLGLPHLELASAPAAPGHYQPGGDNSRLFNVLAEAGVAVGVLRLSGMDYEQKIRAIDEAGERGIPAVIDRAERLNFPDLIHRLRTYSFCAARAGVHMLLENDFYTSCDNAEAQVTLAREIQHPALGFAFSPRFALAGGRNPADEVRALASGLRLVYLWDIAPENGWALEFGGEWGADEENPNTARDPRRVDWSDYFRALNEVSFRGIFNLKWPGPGGWSAQRTHEAIVESVRFYDGKAEEVNLGGRD